MVLASFYQKQNDLLRMQEAIRAGLEANGSGGEPLVDAAHLLTRPRRIRRPRFTAARISGLPGQVRG